MRNCFVINTYNEAINYIHGRSKFKKDYSLSIIKKFLHEFNDPQNKLNAIHVTGTNGKGSTVNFLRNIFQKDGYVVGTFTSPYISKFNERIEINGKPISDDDLLKLVQLIEPVLKKYDQLYKENSLTEFDLVTVIMLIFFASHENDLDVVIIEVGIGGRFDSTNVINPIISVITNVSWDHMNILGNTLKDIAWQKVGILKNSVPLITGKVDDDCVTSIIQREVMKNNSSWYMLNRDFSVLNRNFYNLSFDFDGFGSQFENLKLSMLGSYQFDNAAVALAVYLVFKKINNKNINKKAIFNGLLNSRWKGRFELINQQPSIYIDGAHNVPAIDKLIDLINDCFSNKRVFILFSALIDKNYLTMIKKLNSINNVHLYLTNFSIPYGKRSSISYKDVNDKFDNIFIKDWKNAYNTIIKFITLDDIFIITGSLYFISDVRNYFYKSNY